LKQEIVDAVWHHDYRNSAECILSDYYNGFRLYLRPYKTGYKFYVAIRRFKVNGIDDKLLNDSPVAYFKDCSLNEAKIKGIEHFQWMMN
jgi:hypothetical protein